MGRPVVCHLLPWQGALLMIPEDCENRSTVGLTVYGRVAIEFAVSPPVALIVFHSFMRKLSKVHFSHPTG